MSICVSSARAEPLHAPARSPYTRAIQKYSSGARYTNVYLCTERPSGGLQPEVMSQHQTRRCGMKPPPLLFTRGQIRQISDQGSPSSPANMKSKLPARGGLVHTSLLITRPASSQTKTPCGGCCSTRISASLTHYALLPLLISNHKVEVARESPPLPTSNVM